MNRLDFSGYIGGKLVIPNGTSRPSVIADILALSLLSLCSSLSSIFDIVVLQFGGISDFVALSAVAVVVGFLRSDSGSSKDRFSNCLSITKSECE